MAESAPAGSVGGHREAGTPQALVEALVIIFSPHSHYPAGFEGGPHVLDGPAAVERVIAVVCLCVGSAVQVEDDGVETRLAAVHGAPADAEGNVADLHGYPRIVDGVFCESGQGPPAPFEDGRVQFGHYDLGRRGQAVKDRLERKAHAQAAHQYPGAFSVLQLAAAELAEHHLGTVCQAVHQYLGADHDHKVLLAALSQFDCAFFGGNAFDGFPGLCHADLPFSFYSDTDLPVYSKEIISQSSHQK